jgi:hypothetical protein
MHPTSRDTRLPGSHKKPTRKVDNSTSIHLKRGSKQNLPRRSMKCHRRCLPSSNNEKVTLGNYAGDHLLIIA